jgi:hypothetical protein
VEVSAEIRWFWQGLGAPGLKEWFTDASFHGCAAGGGRHRVDAYLSDPQQVELGVKLRGNKTGVEVKGLVAVLADGCTDSPFVGPVEIWGKWSSEALSLAGASLVLVSKLRWLRKFVSLGPEIQEIALDINELPIGGRHVPNDGCNVEYTEISVKTDLRWVYTRIRGIWNSQQCNGILAPDYGAALVATMPEFGRWMDRVLSKMAAANYEPRAVLAV